MKTFFFLYADLPPPVLDILIILSPLKPEHMKIQTGICIIAVLLILTVSCRKKIEGETSVPAEEQTAADIRMVAGLTREVANVLEHVYRDLQAYKEVNAAIQCGYYHDERVLLRDLLLPGESQLYRSQSFKGLQADTGVFRRKFCEIVERGDYPLLRKELTPILSPAPVRKGRIISSAARLPFSTGVFTGAEPIAIYFPYSENFIKNSIGDSLPPDNKIAIMLRPTLVYTDREADAAPGRAPYYCAGQPGNLCYKTVTVDDAYAEGKPTHIVTIGASIYLNQNAVVPKTELVHRVYHGSSRLTRQMDKLISFTGNGGGSEIKLCRINGYLRRTEEHIEDFSGDLVTLHYTRAEIRKKRWKRVFSIWDPNWNYQDIEQIYAVYEEDNIGKKTFNGSLNTTITLPAKLGKAEGSIGFKIEVSTQDEILTQRKIDRKSYLRDGLNNQGWGFSIDESDFLPAGRDWPIMDGGTVWQYTLPYRIY